eukprot:GEMP01033288.1.p1 GENE.GEMP01033288.1~~GEMP01033288.1.p1  ORF type:complete len:388 (+),score=71.01 GEMP01033288.1:146-1309(+)
MVTFGRLVALLCVYAVLGDLDSTRHRGHRRRLEWFRFKCHVGGAYNLRLGFVVDELFLKKYSSEEDCEAKLRALAKRASNVYENNLGFGLEIAHVVFPRDFTPRHDRLSTRCQGTAKNRLDQFNAFKNEKLADKPVATWVFWTGCDLVAPGQAFLSTMCSTNNNVGTLRMESDMIFVHELGHSLGAEHRSRGIMAGSHKYKGERGQLSEEQESEMCAVVDGSLRKTSSRKSLMNKDLCWTKAGSGTDTTVPTTTSTTSTTTKAGTPTSTTSTTTKAGTPTSTTSTSTKAGTETTTSTTSTTTSATTTTTQTATAIEGNIVLYVVIALLALVTVIVLYVVHRKPRDNAQVLPVVPPMPHKIRKHKRTKPGHRERVAPGKKKRSQAKRE